MWGISAEHYKIYLPSQWEMWYFPNHVRIRYKDSESKPYHNKSVILVWYLAVRECDTDLIPLSILRLERLTKRVRNAHKYRSRHRDIYDSEKALRSFRESLTVESDRWKFEGLYGNLGEAVTLLLQDDSLFRESIVPYVKIQSLCFENQET